MHFQFERNGWSMTHVMRLALLAKVWLCLNLASCLILLWTTGSILLCNQRKKHWIIQQLIQIHGSENALKKPFRVITLNTPIMNIIDSILAVMDVNEQS